MARRIFYLLLIVIGVTTLVTIGCKETPAENGEVETVQVDAVDEESYLQMEPGERNLRALMYETGIYSASDLIGTEYESKPDQESRTEIEFVMNTMSEIKPTKLEFMSEMTMEHEPEPEPDPEPVSDLLSWLANHDSETETFTISKKVQDGHLMVMLMNEVEEKFVFDTGEFSGRDTDWEQVEETYTSREIVDLVYVVYHEVSQDNVSDENRQAQCAVVLNRTKYGWFPADIRKVITQENQYESANCVTNRWLKGDSDLEREDLSRCMPSVLRVLVHETFDEIPEKVIYAAKGKQGSETWMEIQGTYYCFG